MSRVVQVVCCYWTLTIQVECKLDYLQYTCTAVYGSTNDYKA